METVDCLVIGAGVVGLAIARQLAQSGREVIVIETEDGIGQATSSRNSEVIHAGIYYPHDSLMARLCVAGRKALYRYCRERNIAHRRCGKLIVATSEAEAALLVSIAAHARANGVDDIVAIDRNAALRMEPALNVTAALHSPSTGIVDSHSFMLALQGEAEQAGASFAFRAPFRSADIGEEKIVTVGGSEPLTLTCRSIVNAAGLWAPKIAQAMHGFPQEKVPRAYFAKGNYFTLSGTPAPFSRLIYPVPVAGGLGVHLTLDLGGNARFGPDVEWIETIDYAVDPGRGAHFYEAIRRYWPDLPDNSLVPAYSGIRPKIVPPEIAKQDFMILGPRDHGVAGIVQLFGIESPGLTASLAIAEEVEARLAA